MSEAESLPLPLLWGKAASDVDGGYHPVLLHMLDVAAVAVELLDLSLPAIMGSDMLQLAPGATIDAPTLALVVALHDIGKMTPGFQAKVPTLADKLRNAGAAFVGKTAVTDHAQSTAVLGGPLLEEHGATEDAAALAIGAVAGHHGSFHTSQLDDTEARFGDQRWHATRRLGVAELCEAIGARPSGLRAWPSERWLMLVAGLTVAADWIGSNTEFFRYCPAEAASADYFARARIVARKAIEHLGWRRITTGQQPPFQHYFPDFPPNAMQRAVLTAVDALSEPGLIVLEAPTGGGKTAAALYAAEMMNARFGLGGIYFGLPTQATSNQMFGRVMQFLSARPGAVNLHLLHANRLHNQQYRQLRTRSVYAEGRDDGDVVADGWFCGRKRGLLSPYAVGTVDQAMLAALQTRHFFLRMFGLARKVLIIDEVHAYDAFMSPIIERLLRWLRELGSGAILLSATLPHNTRKHLTKQWSAVPLSDAPPYPRLVTVAGNEIHQQAITRPTPRGTKLEWVVGGGERVAQRINDETRAGGCAAWIHNTVAEAQEAHRLLSDLGVPADELVIFHARFPNDERQAREQLVLSQLDKEAARPRRLIVVATQVLEQSLDIDFDMMVTTLAPIDLLLQRAGRLHRHPKRHPHRPQSLAKRTLWVHVNGSVDEPGFGPSQYVYAEQILLRTWWTLRQRNGWTIPDDADDLMNGVYPREAPDAPDGLEPAMRVRWKQSQKALEHLRKTSRAKGKGALVPMPGSEEEQQSFMDDADQGLDDAEAAPHKHADVVARTRDIDHSATLVCLVQTGEGRVQLSRSNTQKVGLDDEPPPFWLVNKLLQRSINVQHRGLLKALGGLKRPIGWQKTVGLRHAWPVVFDVEGKWELGGVSLTLDADRGLIIARTE